MKPGMILVYQRPRLVGESTFPFNDTPPGGFSLVDLTLFHLGDGPGLLAVIRFSVYTAKK
jgi:hypothetical protein